MTLSKYNNFYKAGHFIFKNLVEKFKQKRNDAFSRLKLNNMKRYYVIEGLRILDSTVKKNQRKNLKNSFTRILLHSYGKNKEMVEREVRIFMGTKKLEGFLEKKKLFNQSSALRAVREKAKFNDRRIRKLNDALDRLVRQRKKTVLSTIRNNIIQSKISKTILMYQILDKAVKRRKKEVVSSLQQLLQR